MADEQTSVLIVGGSLVGLSIAVLLSLHGVDSLTVERHTGTAIHPRAGHFHLRTMEILRSMGLEEAVRRKSEEQYHPDGGINNVESLAGREIASYFPNLNAGVAEFSPTVRAFINQDALEPILRARAGELTIEQAYSRYVMRVAPYLGSEDAQPLVDDLSMEIGHRCQSAAAVLEPGDHALHEHPRESRGRPGSRAPHVVLRRAGAEISTLDLFGRGFVLVAGLGCEAWCSTAVRVAARLGIPLELGVVGGAELADPDGRFAEAYGISAAGAVIVRPDGIVAWRAADVAGISSDALHDVLASLVCRRDRRRHKAAGGGGGATAAGVESMRVESRDGDGT